MEKNEINITTDFLCDLWMAVCKEANSDDIDCEDEYHASLVELMAALEKVLFFKLQNEIPNFTKILAIMTEFGQSEPIESIVSLLKTYNPIFDNVHSINEAAFYHKKHNKVNMLFAIILYKSTQESIFLCMIHLTIFYIGLPCMNRP